MMLLDGRVIYACTARLEAREMRLDPLPNKPLLRDLATVIAAADERLGCGHGVLAGLEPRGRRDRAGPMRWRRCRTARRCACRCATTARMP
jgi:succinate dehydrogenase/fumarate reductase-like Fe-S protein